ncbi:restriction endonuclease subunit S [Rhizobium sp. YTUHZ045]|uniref:restriction endonuclease subunit S n=1 Tax=Rhizobium sp. YTUHZ045 TaxID=2962888 RepID=UPI003DA7ED92
MTAKLVPIGDIAEFINGFAFKPEDWSENGLPIIRIQNLTGSGRELNRTLRDVPAKFMVRKGDLLVSWSATLGVFAWQGPDALVNQHIFKVEPRLDRVDIDYLRHAIDESIHRMERFTHGSTMKHINRREFLEHKISLPPLDEQKRIVAILDKADQLRQKRRQAISLLDSLTQSIFLEMFGDPTENRKLESAVTLGEVCSKITDGEHQNPNFTEDGMPIVMASQVGERFVDLNNAKFVSSADGSRFRKKCGPELGDLLIVGRGATIGRATIVDADTPFCLMGSVILLKPNRQLILPQVLQAWIKNPKIRAQLYKTSSSSAQQAIYLSHIKKLDIWIPPMREQSIFSERISKLLALTKQLDARATDDEALFSSLQHRAFSGKL